VPAPMPRPYACREIGEPAGALVVQLRERGHQAIRSPVVSVLAFLRIRTITWTEPTTVLPDVPRW
jgi:hypothetical protein